MKNVDYVEKSTCGSNYEYDCRGKDLVSELISTELRDAQGYIDEFNKKQRDGNYMPQKDRLDKSMGDNHRKRTKKSALAKMKREFLSINELLFLAGNFKNGSEITVYDLLAKLITPSVVKTFNDDIKPYRQGESFRSLKITDVSYMCGRPTPCLSINFIVIVDYNNSKKVQYVKGYGLFEFYRLFDVVFAQIAFDKKDNHLAIHFEKHSHDIVKIKVDIDVMNRTNEDITYDEILGAIKPVIKMIEEQEVSACEQDVPEDYFDKFLKNEDGHDLLSEYITPLFIGTTMEGNIDVGSLIQYNGNGIVYIFIVIEEKLGYSY